VKEPAFEQIVRLPIIRYYEDAFRKATGVPLAVVPPGEPAVRHSFGQCENGFCALATATPAGCAACLEVQVRARRGVALQGRPKQVNCFAGLTDVAVPVVVRGRHVATLMSGQVFRREPTQRDFGIVLNLLAAGRDREWEAKLRKAYFGTPVVTAERFEAIIQLLGVFAQYLVDYIDRHAMEAAANEPAAVANAKRYVQARVDEPITLAQVVEHVRVSRFYFCKLFKRATGMTLTEYVTRIRIEKAKTLLVDPSLRISEVVYASGFGSIPRFNSVFKRHMGMAPTAYRLALHSQLPV
jgi:AraC-like DNA-binding protein/ligand-binding sensor protein